MKYLINTTFHIDREIAAEALRLLREVLMPVATKSGVFSSVELLKILVEVDEKSENFALQLCCGDLQRGLDWLKSDNVVKIMTILSNRFGSKLLHFSTPMQVVE